MKKRYRLFLITVVVTVIFMVGAMVFFMPTYHANLFFHSYGFSTEIQLKKTDDITSGMSRLYFLFTNQNQQEIQQIIRCSKAIGLSAPEPESLILSELSIYESKITQVYGISLENLNEADWPTAYAVIVYDKNTDARSPIYAYVLILNSNSTEYLPLNAGLEDYLNEIKS